VQDIFRYIDALENRRTKAMMYEMHDLILGLIPQVQAQIKWKIPCYDYYGSYFCYLNTFKDHMYISLLNKKDLVSEVLMVEHLKVVSKIYITDLDLLRSDALSELIIQAAVLHEAQFKK